MTVMVDKIFAMVDVDGSGDISSEELFTFLKNLGMGAGGISDVEKIIDQIDEDGDNSIDKKEAAQRSNVRSRLHLNLAHAARSVL